MSTVITVPWPLTLAEAEEILAQLEAGQRLDGIIVHLSSETGQRRGARDLARLAGYPDRTKIRAVRLRKRDDSHRSSSTEETSVSTPTPLPAPARPALSAVDNTATLFPADLVDKGRQSKRKATAAMADRLADLATKLVDALKAEQLEKQNAAEIADLEARLAKLKGKPVKAKADYDPVEVRRWATRMGLEVPSRGRVPAAIVEKYKAAAAS